MQSRRNVQDIGNVDVTARGLIVVSHPSPSSFNHAIARAIGLAWCETGILTEVVDLHKIGFDPCLNINEASGQQTTDASVLSQIALLTASDYLAVVHPNYWGSPPAMMKGWMDRVFAPGAAYTFAKGTDDGSAPVGLLGRKRALIVNTSNTDEARERAMFGDPLERIWRDCLLSYCGVEQIERQVIRIVATSTFAERQGWLSHVGSLARALGR